MSPVNNDVKKRNRVPKSCSVCRSRKIKCDRSQPSCNACLKNDTAHLCRYEEPSWIGSVPSNVSQTSVLEEYNQSRLNDKSISNNPYLSAARIPIAFIPSRGLPLTNNDQDYNDNFKKRRKDSQSEQIESLQSQITSLKALISDLTSTIKSNGNTSFNNYLSPQSLDLLISPALDVAAAAAPYDEDSIDFYGGYKATYVRKSRVMYHGPFSHHAFMTRDKFLLIGWWTINDKEKKRNKLELEFGIKEEPATRKKEVFPLSLSVEDIKSSLQQRIQTALPYKKVIWLLIKRFFDAVYPFHPYLIRGDFLEKISRLIGPESFAEEPVTLEIKGRADFAYIGLLMIILRMSYLSVLLNRYPDDAEPTEKRMHDYLTASPISFNLVTLAQLCLNQFRILRKADLSTFQLALYMRIYNRDAPEYDGNANTFDIQIFTGLLFQMGFSIGLHEDPKDFEAQEANLRRKLWLCLRALDLEETLSTGTPLRLRGVVCNTLLPDYVNERPGSFDDILENRIIRAIRDDQQYIQEMEELALMLTDFKPTRVSELLSKIESLQSVKFVKQNTLFSIMNSTGFVDDVTRCRLVKRYLEIKAVLIKLNIHFMLHYEEHDNYISARQFLVKILELNSDLMANYDFKNLSCKKLSCGNETLFYSFQPAFLASYLVNYSIYLRCEKYSLENEQNLMLQDKLLSIKRIILKNMKNYLFSESRYGISYYTTWRFVKSVNHTTNTLDRGDFFFKNEETHQIDAPKASKALEVPTKNFIEGCPEYYFDTIAQLLDRDKFEYMLVNKLDDYNEGLNQDQSYYDLIINDETWTRHKQNTAGDRFYANLSNHNISYESLNDTVEDLFHDLIDF